MSTILKMTEAQLSKIDIKSFDYPRVTFFAGRERNGQNELEPVTHVYAHTKSHTGHPYVISLYYSANNDNLLSVNAAVDEANRDLKKFWDSQLVCLLESKCARLELDIEERKSALKKSKKILKKLKDKDK